jgi:NAD dependent epimerase/dehydratase family enzyme
MTLGELSGELLGSLRVHPAALLAAGYTFRHPDLETGLRDLLSHSAVAPATG